MIKLITLGGAALVCGAAYGAESGKGAPPELIGKFGSNKEQCVSYHRSTNVMSITKDTFTFCGGSACESKIVGWRRTADGFVLKQLSRNNPKGWSTRVKQWDADTFELVYPDIKKNETLVRCQMKDAIAGIGSEPGGSTGYTSALRAAFQAYYARAVPEVCPSAVADAKLIETAVKASILVWHSFVNKTQTMSMAQATESVTTQRHGAEYAVREDKAFIPDFCSVVLDKFGANGSVQPDLLKDPSKRL